MPGGVDLSCHAPHLGGCFFGTSKSMKTHKIMNLHVPKNWDVLFPEKKSPCGAELGHQNLEKHNRNVNISKPNDSGSYSGSYPTIRANFYGKFNPKSTRIGLEAPGGVDLGFHAGCQGGVLLWNVE